MRKKWLGCAAAIPASLFATVVAADDCKLSGLQVAAGYVTFANLVNFVISIAFCLFAAVFFDAIKDILFAIPVSVWKGIAYLVTLLFCASRHWMPENAVPFGQFVGAVFFAGSLFIILGDVAKAYQIESNDPTTWMLATLLSTGSLAVAQDNAMVAGVSIVALMGVVGFRIMSFPGEVHVGFNSKEAVVRGTITALVVLIPSTLGKITQGRLGDFEVFWPAISWVCTYVAAIGLLIQSSRYFRGGFGQCVLANIGIVLFAVFCIWAGNVHGLVNMQRVAGTILVVWIFEKPWEFPHDHRIGYALLGMEPVSAANSLLTGKLSGKSTKNAGRRLTGPLRRPRNLWACAGIP